MTAIKWTKARRKQLHGFRTPHKTDPADAVLDVPKAWAILKKRTPQVGLDEAPKELRTAYDRRTGAKAPDSLDIATEAALAQMVSRAKDPVSKWEDWSEARATVGLWMGVGGFRFALDVILQNRPYETLRGSSPNGVFFEFKKSKKRVFGAFAGWPLYEPLYWALRSHVAHMSDEALADASASVKDLLKPAPPKDDEKYWHRAALLYVLSRDESVVGSKMDAMMKRLGSIGWNAGEVLAAATTDLDQAASIAEKSNFVRYTLDFLETHGDAGKPILQAQYARRKSGSARQYLQDLRAGLKVVGVST